MKYKVNYLEGELSEITDYLLLNTSFCNNIGVLNGRMGVCLYFYFLSKFPRLSFFQGFANELLDEVIDQINLDTSIDFSSGLSGIAWGIDILFKEDFLEGDVDDVLADYDRQIIEVLCSKEINDNSFNTGLEGVLYYLIYRYMSPCKFLSFHIFDNLINDKSVVNSSNLLSFIEKIDEIASIDSKLKQPLKNIVSDFQLKIGDKYLVDPIYANITKSQMSDFPNQGQARPLGLVQDGCVSRSIYLLSY